MLPGRVVVLDVGKTLAKLSLWGEDGRLLERHQRCNERIESGGRRWLDTEGIERWTHDVLAIFARSGGIAAIVPVAHGAAAAVLRGGRLACPVPDYEDPIEPALRAEYEAQRDPFASTGSPALPDGLNLGVQLHRLECERPGVLSEDARIVPWPQYWAWKLSGVAASEVSSLGCHTDLWRPVEGRPSALARARGWAARLAPLHRADEALGLVTPDWIARTGLSQDTRVYCGAHDSNVALLAARAFPEVAGHEATVISTGTWFVAMRLPAAGAGVDLAALPPRRDCLVNVDVSGRPVPSARFMGGRELDRLGGLDAVDPRNVLAALPVVLRAGAMALPGGIPGVGPHPTAPGGWIAEPRSPASRAAAVVLYAALMVDASLELIGARERLIVEGRFASASLFVRVLAALRSDAQVLVNRGCEGGVAFGALRLVDASQPAPGALERVPPLDLDLTDYRRRWREAVHRPEEGAA